MTISEKAMHYTIEMLINGNSEVLTHYVAANNMWSEIFEDPENRSVNGMAHSLGVKQFWFERNCGGRWIGQEIMVVVGISRFYSSARGFDGSANKALLVYDAFMQSSCSLELKGHARRVAASYDLLEYRK